MSAADWTATLVTLAVFTVAMGIVCLGFWLYDRRHPWPESDDAACDHGPECCGGGVQEEWR